MDNNSETNVHRWVDDHLAKLNPDGEWQPDVTRALGQFEKHRTLRKGSGQKWTWAAAVLAGGVCLMAFPVPRGIAQRCVGACESLFLNKGAVARVSPALNTSAFAPDFTLRDANGEKVRLSDYKGKVVVLNFWATWCAPCQAEIPWFAEFERSYGNRGFAVIGVSMDDDGWKSVKPYVEAKRINYRIAVGDDELGQKYGGVEALPETFLIDRRGMIAAKHVGIVSKSDYEREIVQLLGK